MFKVYKLATALGLIILLLTKVYAVTPLKDPTQPPLYPDPQPEDINRELKINAIFFSADKKAVIIGGHNYNVGDKILDYTVTEINPHSIKVKNENGEYELAMPYSNVKTLTNGKEEREKLD